jgi:hypothetical protein
MRIKLRRTITDVQLKIFDTTFLHWLKKQVKNIFCRNKKFHQKRKYTL